MNRAVLSIVAALTLSMNPATRAAVGNDQSPQKDSDSPCLPDVQISAGAPQTFATPAPCYRDPTPDSMVLIVRTRIRRSSQGEKYLM